MSEDMYTIGVRTFHATMESEMPIRTLFRDRFFPNVIESTDEFIRLETQRRGNVVLPSVRRGSNPLELAANAPHKVDIIEPPYHFYEATVTNHDTKKRVFGEPVDAPYSRNERAQVLMAEKLFNGARKSLALMQEAYASQILRTGKATLKTQLLDGTIKTFGEVAFDVNSDLVGKNKATGTTKWTSSTDILKQISDLAMAIFEESGKMPTEMILGADAFAVLRTNTTVAGFLDNRRVEGNKLETFPFAGYPGASISGYLNVPFVGTITLITYVNGYEYPGDAALTPMIGPKEVILTTPGWGAMGYGALEDRAADGFPTLIPGKQLIHTELGGPREGFAFTGFIQSAGLPVPTELDAWGSFTVV